MVACPPGRFDFAKQVARIASFRGTGLCEVPGYSSEDVTDAATDAALAFADRYPDVVCRFPVFPGIEGEVLFEADWNGKSTNSLSVLLRFRRNGTPRALIFDHNDKIGDGERFVFTGMDAEFDRFVTDRIRPLTERKGA